MLWKNTNDNQAITLSVCKQNYLMVQHHDDAINKKKRIMVSSTWLIYDSMIVTLYFYQELKDSYNSLCVKYLNIYG